MTAFGRFLIEQKRKVQKRFAAYRLFDKSGQLQSLIHIVFRVHQHQYSVSADIERTFLQVGVIEMDQPSLLLRPGDTATIVAAFKCNPLIPGSNDSPTYVSKRCKELPQTREKKILKLLEATKKVFRGTISLNPEKLSRKLKEKLKTLSVCYDYVVLTLQTLWTIANRKRNTEDIEVNVIANDDHT